LDTCNSLGWKNPFNQSNAHLAGELGLSKPKLIEVRNKLKQFGLIDFVSGRVKRELTQYKILGLILFTLNDTLNDTLNNTLNDTLNDTLNAQNRLHNIKQETKLNKTTLKEKINKKENSENIFENFRKKYAGTKRGLKTEFDFFKSKHKDWQNILPLLLPAIEKQTEWRAAAKAANVFVPEWKHLKTWLGNRCWEEELNFNFSNNETDSELYKFE
jgi:hypothetical protein